MKINVNDIREYDINPESLFIAKEDWLNVNWNHVKNWILCKQVKIFEASGDKDKKTMVSIQEEIISSLEAKLLATRRVLQENRGSK